MKSSCVKVKVMTRQENQDRSALAVVDIYMSVLHEPGTVQQQLRGDGDGVQASVRQT